MNHEARRKKMGRPLKVEKLHEPDTGNRLSPERYAEIEGMIIHTTRNLVAEKTGIHDVDDLRQDAVAVALKLMRFCSAGTMVATVTQESIRSIWRTSRTEKNKQSKLIGAEHNEELNKGPDYDYIVGQITRQIGLQEKDPEEYFKELARRANELLEEDEPTK